MKQCTWCGKEYPDEAIQCAIDAFPLASVGPAPSQKSDAQTETSESRVDAAKNGEGQVTDTQPDWIEQRFRSRRFWCGLLLVLYFLPSLLAGAPIALALPWVLIPNAYLGLATILGLGPSFRDETTEIWFATGFHLVFWPIGISLLFFSRRMSRPVLWIMSWLMIVTVVMMIPGCARTINAVGH